MRGGAVVTRALVPSRQAGDKRGVPAATAALRPILDYALPPRCPACGVIVTHRVAFCVDCWSALTLSPDVGGRPSPLHIDRVMAACAYDEVARAVVLAFKHGNRPRLAVLMAGLMVAAAGQGAIGPGDLIVPVPLHWSRLWARRYNQAGLLAREVARRTGATLHIDALVRTRATRPQHHDRAGRAEAVRGAFALGRSAAERLTGRRVVLIDDVLTTGATASGCARVLRQGGAARVDLLCWALVPPSR